MAETTQNSGNQLVNNSDPVAQVTVAPTRDRDFPDAAKNEQTGVHQACDPIKNPARAIALPRLQRGEWTVVTLALMIFLVPTVGVPYEEMLQDTLKSMVVSFFAVIAGLLFFWQQRNRREDLRWHALLWLPLSLTVYALGSMAWSHSYLAGVEAIRWFIFSLILFLGINTFSREQAPHIVDGIHWGAVIASLWTALQFWNDFSYFAQGPNPASTFVNRNFFAEFVVCTIPFSLYLLVQARGSARVALLAFTLGFNIVALMMTGTRGALMALWLELGFVFPLILFVFRKQFAFVNWGHWRRLLACAVLLSTVAGLGLVKCGNPKLIADGLIYGTGLTAFDRAFKRTASISADDSSLGTRLIMWKATGRLIEDRPWFGVGAGAWEAMIPLYQSEGSQLETDYYPHNEILQLLAEYGLTGWIFLIALLSYLFMTAWKTFRSRSAQELAEAPLRAITLSSLMALMIVSNIGFPWRLASTGCMFALSLALLGASDARLQRGSAWGSRRLPWRPVYSHIMFAFMLFCFALTAYISHQAATAEREIVTAVKLALAVSQSGDYNNPKWDKTKNEIVTLTKEAVAINTHYRKITPIVADEMARWGDWEDAVWIWESVVRSRPYVVTMMSNIARGYAQLGNNQKALEYLARCEILQPRAPAVRSLKIILLSRTGQEAQAALLAKKSLDDGILDFDLVNAAYVLGMRKGDNDLVEKSLKLKLLHWPKLQSETLIKLARFYQNQEADDIKALETYKAALLAAPPLQQYSIRQQIPPAFLAKIQ